MPPIKGWSRQNGRTWEHDSGVQLRLVNSGQTRDGRHSLWFAELYIEGEWQADTDVLDQEIVQGATSRPQARKEAVAWMRKNPTLSAVTANTDSGEDTDGEK